MKDKKIKYYSIYIEKENGDLKNIFSVDTLDQLIKWIGTNKTKESIKSYITRHQKIDNKYIVYKDFILESEL